MVFPARILWIIPAEKEGGRKLYVQPSLLDELILLLGIFAKIGLVGAIGSAGKERAFCLAGKQTGVESVREVGFG